MERFKKIAKIVIVAIISVICVFFIITGTNALYFNDHIVTVTVTDKGIKQTNNSSKYLIYGTKANGEVETYEITDNFSRGQFDSSNKYGAIRIGETYNFIVIGVRIPYLSQYENIIGIE